MSSSNNPPPPDQTQAMLALQHYASQMAGGNKQTAVFGILHDVHFSSFSLQGLSPLAKNITGLNGLFRAGKPSPLQNAMNIAMEDFKKMAQNAGVIYSGEVVNNNATSGLQPPSPGGGRGGGFDLA